MGLILALAIFFSWLPLFVPPISNYSGRCSCPLIPQIADVLFERSDILLNSV
jgi:hypothetical protein